MDGVGGTARSGSPLFASGVQSPKSVGQGSQVLGMTGGPSMRAQLDSIAMTTHEIVGRVELAGRQILMLEEDRDRIKAVIQAQDAILNEKIVAETNRVSDDVNHKLALQVAENKRLQAQLTRSQADIARLTRLAESLALRVQMLEAHTGVSS